MKKGDNNADKVKDLKLELILEVETSGEGNKP